jgi:hypothetical protein
MSRIAEDETKPYTRRDSGRRTDNNAMRLVLPIGAVIGVAAVAFGIGGGWTRATAASNAVEGLEVRVRLVEQAVATMQTSQALQIKDIKDDINEIKDLLQKIGDKLP